jgi:predicted nucleic acid-binding protein
MAADFLDTSALAKHYHLEQGSLEVDQLWSDSTRGLYVSRLSAVELISVFAGKLRSGAIASADFDALRRRFAADLTKTRRLIGTRLLVAHYQEAERLLRQHGPLRRLRTLDALQLAVAVDLHRKALIGRIVSSDKDLLVAAAVEGLGVFDPENP